MDSDKEIKSNIDAVFYPIEPGSPAACAIFKFYDDLLGNRRVYRDVLGNNIFQVGISCVGGSHVQNTVYSVRVIIIDHLPTLYLIIFYWVIKLPNMSGLRELRLHSHTKP